MTTSIFFFGGYNAKPNDMKLWKDSAASQRPKDVVVFTYAWPEGAGSRSDSAITGFRNAGMFKDAVSRISSSSADQIYIVGHSSGCAIANEVDSALPRNDKVSLVALDGFAPNAHQLGRPSTQIWAAVCGSAKSRNHDSLKSRVGGKLRIYQATNCKTEWALHFSLVNAAATDAIVTSVATGYSHCWANLCWMG